MQPFLVHFPGRLILARRQRDIEAEVTRLAEEIDKANTAIRLALSGTMIGAGVGDEAHRQHVSDCVETLIEEAFGRALARTHPPARRRRRRPARWPFPRAL